MTIEMRVETAGLKGLAGGSAGLRWALGRLIATEADKAARDMKDELARQGIAATSLLIESVKADAVDELTWIVGPHVNYARFVLEGRKPGARLPPWQSIADWLRVRQRPSDRASAWAVARAIQRRGVKGRDYLTPVARRVLERLERRGATVVLEQGLGRVG